VSGGGGRAGGRKVGKGRVGDGDRFYTRGLDWLGGFGRRWLRGEDRDRSVRRRRRRWFGWGLWGCYAGRRRGGDRRGRSGWFGWGGDDERRQGERGRARSGAALERGVMGAIKVGQGQDEGQDQAVEGARGVKRAPVAQAIAVRHWSREEVSPGHDEVRLYQG